MENSIPPLPQPRFWRVRMYATEYGAMAWRGFIWTMAWALRIFVTGPAMILAGLALLAAVQTSENPIRFYVAHLYEWADTVVRPAQAGQVLQTGCDARVLDRDVLVAASSSDMPLLTRTCSERAEPMAVAISNAGDLAMQAYWMAAIVSGALQLLLNGVFFFSGRRQRF